MILSCYSQDFLSSNLTSDLPLQEVFPDTESIHSVHAITLCLFYPQITANESKLSRSFVAFMVTDVILSVTYVENAYTIYS